MASGFLALLDDVAAIAKVAASSLDDVAAAAGKAGSKAVGVVIDDAAVTPGYAMGFSPARELPIVWKIALGSLKNKLLYLLPAALALSWFAPFLITPLLALGGLYLCFEGAEKIIEALWPHAPQGGERSPAPQDPAALENEKVRGAIATDFILSAEIMAITLASVADQPFWTRALVLAVVGMALTALVYGVVALIVKADDAGAHLAREGLTAPGRAFGRGLVKAAPSALRALSVIGTAAMLWVGGGIVLHAMEGYGASEPAHSLNAVAQAIASAAPALHAAVHWLVEAAGAGLFGLALGVALVGGKSLVDRMRGAAAAH